MSKRERVAADASRRKPGSLTSDFVFESSWFSGSSINYRIPCTSSEGRLCDIFRDITTWNEFFWQVCFGLRELSPGQLSFVKIDGVPIESPEPQYMHEAAMLLQRLLTHHRCLVSVVFDYYLIPTEHHRRICSVLPRSPGLRKLRVSLLDMPLLRSFAAVLPLLNHLQELDCTLMKTERIFCERLSELLVSTASLTTLALTAPKMEPEDGVVIFDGLKRNTTVTKLLLDMCMSAFLSQRGVVFADYVCDNQTLRTLIVISCGTNNAVNVIIRSLFRTTTISEVKLIDFRLDDENSRLVAELLSENRSLRDFHMISCSLYGNRGMAESDGVSGRICPWIVALRENRTLERLTMGLCCFNLEECRSFIQVIASNKTLTNVTVVSLRPADEAEICRALRETGVQERFFLARDHAVEDPAGVLTAGKQFHSIIINPRTLRGLDGFRTALCLLPSCSHVTSLTLSVWPQLLNGDSISLMAQYIAGTTVLRDLDLSFSSGTSNTVDRIERALMQALSCNKSIRKLIMIGCCFDETEIQMLVDMLQASRTLCDLTFYPHYLQSTTCCLLMQKLSPIVSNNYTLLRMQVDTFTVLPGDLFTVDDVVRRNLSLVTRAAHFVMGTRHRYCAAAAELVRSNPGLVVKVQELASIDENEAMSRIEQGLKSFSELDDFMCVAGVVKYGVTCHSRDDGQLQLTDLNRDCWLYLRQYVKVGDILDPQ